jgi:hypothetical protein
MVKNADPRAFRQVSGHAPKIIMFQLVSSRLFKAEHLAALRIDPGQDIPDSAVLAAGFSPLKISSNEYLSAADGWAVGSDLTGALTSGAGSVLISDPIYRRYDECDERTFNFCRCFCPHQLLATSSGASLTAWYPSAGLEVPPTAVCRVALIVMKLVIPVIPVKWWTASSAASFSCQFSSVPSKMSHPSRAAILMVSVGTVVIEFIALVAAPAISTSVR